MSDRKELPEPREVFAAELGGLPEPWQAIAAAALADLAPPYVWYVPASLSGSYHPRPCGRRLGGLVAHVRLAYRVAMAELERIDRLDNEALRGIVGAAVLLHDLHKFERPDALIEFPRFAGEQAIDSHGLWTAEAIDRWACGRHDWDDAVEPEQWTALTAAVRWHMGRWSARLDERDAAAKTWDSLTLRAVGIVQLADYIASRPLDRWLEDVQQVRGPRSEVRGDGQQTDDNGQGPSTRRQRSGQGGAS